MRKGTMHKLHCMSWNRCSKERHAMPCEVEGARLSAWRLAKAARLSAVLVFCVSLLYLPTSGELLLQCLIIKGCVSARPEHRCCWLLNRSWPNNLTEGRPLYYCNSGS